MADLRREDPCSLALTLRLARRMRGIKQAHAAELLGVTQSTVSRIDRGDLKPTGLLRNRLLDLVSARIDPARDAALRRLVESSAAPLHLVCDLTHRLLAASRPREREWRRGAAELRGQPLWKYASRAIRSAEMRLPDLGWGERDGAHAFAFMTGANGLDELRILPGVLIWERILLSDGSPARLVTSPAQSTEDAVQDPAI
jgi:transcriptional regulator with XRE-family HTH domain